MNASEPGHSSPSSTPGSTQNAAGGWNQEPPLFPAPVPLAMRTPVAAPPSPPKASKRPGHAKREVGTRTTPVPRTDPTGISDLANLASKANSDRLSGLDYLSAVGRIDPYYKYPWPGGKNARLWHSGPDGEWMTPDQFVDWPANKKFPATLKPFAVPQSGAIKGMLRRTKFKRRLAALGAVHAWGTLMVQQLAAFSGDPASRNVTAQVPSTLFCAGLIDIGQPDGSWRYGTISKFALVRPADTKIFASKVSPRLTEQEWFSITGGRRWGPRVNAPRHNVLAAEFALRYAEYSPDVIGVVGERFCTADLLAGTGAGLAFIKSRRTADAALIRKDGARIAIEIVAHTNEKNPGKVNAWAKTLAERPAQTSGLSVIFVVVGDVKHSRTDTRPAVYKAIQDAVRKHPGPRDSPTAQRMGVVTWEELFPGPHQVTTDFLGLRVDRPTGPADALWEPADALDPRQVPGPSKDAKAVLLQCMNHLPYMGQTPCWLRPEPTTDLDPTDPAFLLGGGRYPTGTPMGRRKPAEIDPAFPLGVTPEL